MKRPAIEFWYEFASSYSYLAAMRIEAEAVRAGVGIVWRPFLLGPIFAQQGWTTSPFNRYPAKGRYMWRDMAREAEALGLPFRQPDPFPQNSLLPARLALVGVAEGWAADFSKAVFRAGFGEGRDISEPALMTAILLGMDLDAASVMAAARSDGNKSRLRAQCDEARERGIFGAPTFLAPDGEMFWGNDRLERALAWAARA